MILSFGEFAIYVEEIDSIDEIETKVPNKIILDKKKYRIYDVDLAATANKLIVLAKYKVVVK